MYIVYVYLYDLINWQNKKSKIVLLHVFIRKLDLIL